MSAPRSSPTLFGSAARILELSLGQMLWSRRSVFLGLLLGLPVVMAAAIRTIDLLYRSGVNVNGVRIQGATIFGLMVWGLYIRFIIPVLGVFFGTSLIADEVDDKTITYLFTRPIPRRAVLIGKYLAYLVCTVLLVLPSVMIVFFLIVPTGGGSIAAAFPSLLKDFGMLAIGLAAYGAVFALVGTRIKRPLIVGLVFAFGWEPAVLLFPGYMKRLTVAYYMQALVTHEMPQDSAVSVLMQVFREVPSIPVSLLALAVIVVGAVWLAGRTVEDKEYVLEQ
jgi:ABC-type transport system involved in multi-copper enzyme maturation permease subunit